MTTNHFDHFDHLTECLSKKTKINELKKNIVSFSYKVVEVVEVV